MKRLALLLFISGISWNINAQDLKKIEEQYKPIKVPDPGMDPMTGRAFNKYLIDHFSYTILGSTGPATGLKVETASPSISLKGTLFKSNRNSQIVTLELQAGADSKIMQVFSENKWSNYFKAAVGYNVLIGPGKVFGLVSHPFKNKAFYDIKNSYLIYTYRNAGVVKYQELVRQGQKASVTRALLNEQFMTTANSASLIAAIDDTDLKKAGAVSEILKKLTMEVMAEYGIKFPEGTAFETCLDLFAKNWKNPTVNVEEKQKFLKYYEKQATIKKNAVDSLYRYEIEQVKNNYTGKSVWWFNASPFISSTNFKEYTVQPATLADKSSILFGTKLSLNYFWKSKLPHRYFYLTAGIAPQKINSLDEMTKYTYKKTTKIELPGAPVTETLSKEEAGTGYQGKFQDGFGMEYFVETYFVPWKPDYIPGFYTKLSYSNSSKRINQERTAAYLGLVWNLTNGEKDAKNLLSIVPFAGWANLNPQQYTDGVKTGNRPLHDLFTAGIQVGIPINIGK